MGSAECGPSYARLVGMLYSGPRTRGLFRVNGVFEVSLKGLIKSSSSNSCPSTFDLHWGLLGLHIEVQLVIWEFLLGLLRLDPPVLHLVWGIVLSLVDKIRVPDGANLRRPMPSLCLGCRYSLETSLLNSRDSDVAQVLVIIQQFEELSFFRVDVVRPSGTVDDTVRI
ncbi:hypothetical protein Tco_0420990 [Tanacetum coccineum]